jgi:outer membrane protein OmpA-like peptidoglycan-associated protein
MDGNFGPAINLGTAINSSGDEVFPFGYEGKLYFSSNAANGIGGLDIYQVGLSSGSKPQNMRKPYNTPQDDFAYYVDRKGVKYLSSDRGLSESRDNIYSMSYLAGKYVFRFFAEDGKPLEMLGRGEMKILNADGQLIPLVFSDKVIAELPNGEYTVEVKKKGYFPTRTSLQAVNEGRDIDVDLNMIAIPYGKQLDIDTIYYDLNKYNIRQDGSEILDRVAELLKEYPEFNLTITSFTDSRASSKYNEELSQKRSHSAKDYLISRGISPSKIYIDFRGEADLVNPCGDGKACPEFMHEKNRRSILGLELYPDPNADYELPVDINRVRTTEEFLDAMILNIKNKLKGFYSFLH